MEHSNPPATSSAEQGLASDAAIRSAAIGTSFGRTLERAAVRDLQASSRAAWRAQDAEDNARIEQLRQQRNAELEQLDREALAVNTAHGLAMSEQRVAWIEANATAAVKRREANRVIREEHRREAPSQRAALEELHHRHNQQLDELANEELALRTTYALAVAELRASWLDTQNRARMAKRASKAALRELREQQAAERPGRTAQQDADRRTRNEASDARWDAAHKAATEHALAVVELREAKRTQANDVTIGALQAREAELRAVAGRLEREARAEEHAAWEALMEERRAASTERGLAQAQLQEEWLAARHEADVERRRARDAVRAFQKAAKPEMNAALARIRARRNAVNDQYTADVTALRTSRGLRDAELRSEYLEIHATAARLKAEAREANRAYAREHRASEQAQLNEIRERKNAACDSFSQGVLRIRTTRGVERAEQRELARDTARGVLTRYRAELATQA